MRKELAILGLVAIAILAMSAIGYADVFNAIMVQDNGSETPQPGAQYDDTQTPWLFLDTFQSYLHSFYTTWSWQNSTKWEVLGHVDLESTTDAKSWLTLSDWSGMPTGKWRVAALLSNDEPGSDMCCSGKCVYFERVTKPVPEPVSSALFLLGAGALGLRLYRKRKTQN